MRVCLYVSVLHTDTWQHASCRPHLMKKIREDFAIVALLSALLPSVAVSGDLLCRLLLPRCQGHEASPEGYGPAGQPFPSFLNKPICHVSPLEDFLVTMKIL